MTKSRRASTATTMPIAAQSIHEGKNDPMTLICGPTASLLSLRRRAGVRALPRGEREGRRGVQQLDLRIELDEARTTELAPGGEEVGERAEAQTIGSERILVRELRCLDQSRGDVEAAEGKLDVGVGLPDLADGAVARRRDLILGGPTRRFGQLDAALTGSAIEELPLEEQPDAIARLGRAEPPGGLAVGGDPRAAQDGADVADQRQGRPVSGAGPADLGLGRAQRRDASDEVGSLLERAIDGLLDGIL